MKYIRLTKGQFAIVDDSDFAALSKFKWFAARRSYGGFAAARAGPGGKHLYMHRQILNTPAHLQVDHKNHCPLDNRRCNIRNATRSQNMQNRGAMANHTSRFRGVSWSSRRKSWEACIYKDRRKIFLGYFSHEVEAAFKYDESARQLFGEFAHPNFPHEASRAGLRRRIEATHGTFFAIWFVKKSTGSLRHMCCRTGVRKYRNGRGMNYDPVKKKIGIVFDLREANYRAVPLENVLAIQIRGQRYKLN